MNGALAALLLLVPAAAWAWGGPGHAAVAVLAYRELSAEQRTSFTDLLRSHPQFPSWRQDLDELRGRGLSRDVDLGMYLFIRASNWPDEIRGTGTRFDHPNWHFVDYPLRPPSFTSGPRPEPGDDVVFGLQESLAILRDPREDPTSRAAHLGWLIHLMGDIHQPLHCVSLFSSQFPPPEGDRGGNLFLVSRPGIPVAVNLHSFWDTQLGRGAPDPETALENAIALAAEHPRARLAELASATTIEAWSLESRDVASERVYRYEEIDSNGRVRLRRLRGSTNDRRAPLLPRGYAEAARTVARRRLSLAGYRLYDQLAPTVPTRESPPGAATARRARPRTG